jgi:hypothetical protein
MASTALPHERSHGKRKMRSRGSSFSSPCVCDCRKRRDTPRRVRPTIPRRRNERDGVLQRNRATGRPDVRTTGRVMMEFWLSTRGRVTPTARRVWRLFSTSAVESTALVFRLFSSALCTRQVMTVLSLASSEARDPLILSVTRGLLHRSEQVALRQMMRGGVQLAVMPRGVHRVALIARGVGRIRVTRVARHIR